MTPETFAQSIQEKCAQRFQLEAPSEQLLALAKRLNLQAKVAVLQLRPRTDNGGIRTVLIASSDTPEQTDMVNRWAAQVRDILGEPQTADLYLFHLGLNESLDQAIQREADDRFCRRYVERRDDDPDSLLDRTFMSKMSVVVGDGVAGSGIEATLRQATKKHPALERRSPGAWVELLLSEEEGPELTERLLKEWSPPNGGEV